MQAQISGRTLLFCIGFITLILISYQLIGNKSETNNQSAVIVGNNYQKLRWFSTQIINGENSQYKYSLSQFNLEQLNQANKITSRTNRFNQIKAISKGLNCVLLYDHASGILRAIQFQLPSKFHKSMINIQNKEIMQAAATNHSKFEIADNCLALRIQKQSFHLNQNFTTYVQDTLPSPTWTNEAFNDNFEYVVTDDGIYKFNSSHKSYILIIPTELFKNKNIRVLRSRVVVWSWEIVSGANQNKIRYRVQAFVLSSKNKSYVNLGKLDGQFYDKETNRDLKVSISQNLDTIGVYGQENGKKMNMRGLKIDYQKEKYERFSFPEVLRKIMCQIQVSSNYIYARKLVSIEENDQKQQFFFRIKGSSLQKFLYRKVPQEKTNDKVEYLLHQVSPESLFLLRVQQTNGVVYIEKEKLQMDIGEGPEPFIVEAEGNFSFLAILIPILLLCFCYCSQVVKKNQKSDKPTVAKQKQRIKQQKQQKQIEDYCKVLKIPTSIASDLKKLNTQKLKSAYTKLIRQFRHNSTERISINRAYEYLNQRYYDIKYSFLESMLIRLILEERKYRLRSFLEENKQFLSFRLKKTNYPLLYFAVRGGCYQIVEQILQMGCGIDFKNDRSTPMHAAAYYGHYQIIGLLLQYGVPYNIKNFQGNSPIQEAASKEMQALLADADQDNIHKLITQLVQQKLCLLTFNITQNEQTIAKKIILYSYTKEFSQHEDTFHGTNFHNFKSIAKHSLKKPGDIVEGKEINIVPGHITRQNWKNAVFVSPSLLYAGNPVYSKEIINTTNKKSEVWLPVVQAKVKKNCYQKRGSTVGDYKCKEDEPQMVEYRIEKKTADDQENITVVALLLIHKEYLNSIQRYEEVKNVFLNCKQEVEYKSRLYHMAK